MENVLDGRTWEYPMGGLTYGRTIQAFQHRITRDLRLMELREQNLFPARKVDIKGRWICLKTFTTVSINALWIACHNCHWPKISASVDTSLIVNPTCSIVIRVSN